MEHLVDQRRRDGVEHLAGRAQPGADVLGPLDQRLDHHLGAGHGLAGFRVRGGARGGFGVFHDDFLPGDGTCVYVALQTRLAAASGSVHLGGLRCFTYAGPGARALRRATKPNGVSGLGISAALSAGRLTVQGKRHIISVTLQNEVGALTRVAGLFSTRGYNIESLTVAPTEDPTMSRMTIVTSGSDDIIEQITKHLNRLIEVVKVVDLTEGAHIERELMLIKVRAGQKEREDMKRMADIFRGRIIDVTDKSYTIELTGTTDKLDAFLEALDRGAILETVRTGVSGIGRGEWVLKA